MNFHTTFIELNTLVKKFWETEEPPKSSTLTPDESECEAIFANTHYRTNQGRHVVKLPFKSNQPVLGSSREAAVTALLRLEKRFNRDSTLFTAYSEFINEYLTMGHMELVQNESENSSRSYYLPHHAVLKPSSTTTKLRVVFNGSQQSSNGYSLNDILHIGPKLQNDVILVLTRWRFFRYVYTADIAKMYRQILVDKSDADFQRILWRDSPNDPICSYRLLTVTYGTASAPYLACKTLQQLANDYKSQHKKASKILLENFYVDDALFGAFDFKEALDLRSELDTLLRQGGFKLRKWLSNYTSLLDGLPLEDRELTTPSKIVSDIQIKALGVEWSPDLDSFGFNLQLSNSIASTKRSVLADISRIYDPCGWLSPVTIAAKIFLQTLWKNNIDWDVYLPADLNAKWLQYKRQLQELNRVRIPRWIRTTNINQKVELHGFCDASQDAYGAVVYLRIIHDKDNVEVRLLASKTRVSPIRTVSLPRLELCGAVMLAELLPYLQSNLNLLEVPLYTWTDSTVVLAWLRAHPSKWKVFVVNRVALVHENLSNAVWQHVPTEDNPADSITRGIPTSELQKFDLWWQGPSWLSLSAENWPVTKLAHCNDAAEEARTITCTTACTSTSPPPEKFTTSLLQRFSDLMRLFRVTAYCLRFSHLCRPLGATKCSSTLTLEEINAASEVLIRMVQHETFSMEMKLLSKDKRATLPSHSKLRMLNPILDEKSLLRVGGRLKHALLSEDEKFPLILPAESHLKNLVIAYSHLKTLHGGTQATLHHVRSKYWIINGRNKIKQFIRRCVICCRMRGACKTPLMGDLPIDRVRPAKPFLHSGVDFAGPFIVKAVKGRSRTKLKTYVACFICFVTRAIHLELVMDLTAEAFIAALRRFVSRRGRVARIYSDNGRTFVAADKQLSQHVRELVSKATIPQTTLKDGIEWHFIPPYSPHMGDLWEAGIKAMKPHLKRVVRNYVLSIEEMLTLLAQVESCLNSRPLQAISDDPTDINALTPGHFLVEESLLAVPEPSLSDMTTHHLNRWQLVQHLHQNIWIAVTKKIFTIFSRDISGSTLQNH